MPNHYLLKILRIVFGTFFGIFEPTWKNFLRLSHLYSTTYSNYLIWLDYVTFQFSKICSQIDWFQFRKSETDRCLIPKTYGDDILTINSRAYVLFSYTYNIVCKCKKRGLFYWHLTETQKNVNYSYMKFQLSSSFLGNRW